MLWHWYAEETYEFDGARSRDIALDFAELCNEHFPDMQFEVIGMSQEDHHPQSDEQFLGFDVTWPASVTLPEVLALKRDPKAEDPLDVLDDLMRRYYGPKLNEFGIFRTLDEASHCCRSIMAIQHTYAMIQEPAPFVVKNFCA
jgi:hypothetical protein